MNFESAEKALFGMDSRRERTGYVAGGASRRSL